MFSIFVAIFATTGSIYSMYWIVRTRAVRVEVNRGEDATRGNHRQHTGAHQIYSVRLASFVRVLYGAEQPTTGPDVAGSGGHQPRRLRVR